MTLIQKVAIAGATGSLGAAVTKEIAKAGFHVTALTRDASTAKVPAGVTPVSVDYDSVESLTKALQGQDAVISTLGSPGLKQQKALIDAAIAAGVKRIIPSEFGSDHSHDEARALPVYADKITAEKYLIEKVKGTDATYTIFTNNAFLDWGIEKNFILNVKDKKAYIYDGGDVPFTTTPLYLVGQGLVGVLRNPAETANREVRAHGRTTTLNELLTIVKEFGGSDGWESTPYDTAEHSRKAYKILESDPANLMAWVIPMINRAAFGKGLNLDFADKNDNELLGISALSEDEFRKVIKDSVAVVRSS